MLQRELRRITIWGVIGCVIVYMLGWQLTIIEGDAAYYAASSLEMIKKQEFFHFIDFDGSHPGLAPLSFWLSHLSMSAFGPGNIPYHIPALFLTLLTLFSVYRFSRLYYSKEVATLAVLITATLQSTFVLNRTADATTGLTAFYMFTIWQLAEYFRERKLQNLIGSVIGVLLAVLSKSTYSAGESAFGPLHQISITLWAFAPWIIWMLLAMTDRVRSLINGLRGGGRAGEYFTLGGFLLPYLLFLFNPAPSRYDVFMLYPLAAIITSAYMVRIIYEEKPQWLPRAYFLQILLLYVWLSALFAAVWFPFPENNYFGLIHFMAMLSALTYLIFFSGIKNKLIISCMLVGAGTNLVLNSYFYPNLYNYQAGARLGVLARNNDVKADSLYTLYNPYHYALHFYSGVPAKTLGNVVEIKNLYHSYVYTDLDSLPAIRRIRPDARIIGNNPDFHGRDLDIRFLNPETRDEAISRKVLIGL